MVVYVFDISRISKCIKEFTFSIVNEDIFGELREYVVMSLINEYQLPLNIHYKKIDDSKLSKYRDLLFNKCFHEFACTYTNIYNGLLNMLDGTNSNFDLLDMKIENNLLMLNVRGGSYE